MLFPRGNGWQARGGWGRPPSCFLDQIVPPQPPSALKSHALAFEMFERVAQRGGERFHVGA